MGFKKENNFLTSEKSFSECEQNLKNLVKEFKDKKLAYFLIYIFK